MESKARIKVSELFYSIQGEGFHVGTPSIFLRTFGCNFTCGSFGMPAGQRSTERDAVDASAIKTYKELPLVTTGCDSYASWDPRFKHLSPVLTQDAIIERMTQLLPRKKFGIDAHLVITGGEPLLGWQKQFIPLLRELMYNYGLTDVTFETNGTQKLSPELEAFVKTSGIRFTFSVSPKLSNSGEDFKNAHKPDVIRQYQEASKDTYLKFVIGTDADAEEALQWADFYEEFGGFNGSVYFMPVGGTAGEAFFKTEKEVAILAMNNGVRFSPRIQVNLFKNEWGT